MGYIDFHTHILPNIDDGVLDKKDLDKMLSIYKEAGFSEIVCTPHLYNPYVHTNVGDIKDTFTYFKDLAKSVYNIDCYIGSEYYYLNQQQIVGIPIASKYQLIELPTTLPPIDFIDKFYNLTKTGMKIILAHVERYPYLKYGTPELEKLINMGVLIQVNASSLSSGRGLEFVENEVADLLATDNHGNFKLPYIYLDQIGKYPYLQKRMAKIKLNHY
ncbi:MAG: CpsB/CapC family capsule biosynthesis tyrosine phosphatase [Pleomorphochaeta sp.]